MELTSNHQSIIIITNTLFYPARRNGLSIRYFPLLHELNKLGYIIDIIVINKDREFYPENDIRALKEVCRNINIVEPCEQIQTYITKQGRRIANLFHLLNPSGIPYSLIDNCRHFYFSRVIELLENRNRYDFGIGVGVGGNNAELLLSLNDIIKPKHILCDYIDSAYLLRKRKTQQICFCTQSDHSIGRCEDKTLGIVIMQAH